MQVSEKTYEQNLHALISKIDSKATRLDEGSGRIVYLSGDKESVYKIAKNEQGLIQNENEFLQASIYETFYPKALSTHACVKNQDETCNYAIIQMETIYSIQEIIKPYMKAFYKRYQTLYEHDTEYEEDLYQIEHVLDTLNYEQKELCPEYLFHHTLKNYIHTSEHTFIEPDSFNACLDDVVSDAFLTQCKNPSTLIADVEIVSENIGLKKQSDGTYRLIIIDGGITDDTFFDHHDFSTEDVKPIQYV